MLIAFIYTATLNTSLALLLTSCSRLVSSKMAPTRPANLTQSAKEHTRDLITQIDSLISALPETIPEATKDDIIYTAMKANGDTPFETFNRRMDAIIGEDLRDEQGRLRYLRRGRHGLKAVCAYLERIMDSDQPGMQYALMDIKLERLIAELKFYQQR